MFGYIIANSKLLEEEDKKKYSVSYCSLCHALAKEHKFRSKITLNYDMTFLLIILNEVYKDKFEIKELEAKCLLHPIKKHNYLQNELIDYVADMNIILSYYNLMDDWKDDKNIFAYSYSKIIENEVNTIAKKHPQKVAIIKQKIQDLNEIEKKNILNPDIPAKCCGEFFGEFFSPYDDEYKEMLKDFGVSLGKFIYILDACIDLKGDIKHKRYNPLITTSKDKFDDILNVLMAEVIENYKKLNISNKLIDNILYSGIWTKYDIYKKKEEKK